MSQNLVEVSLKPTQHFYNTHESQDLLVGHAGVLLSIKIARSTTIHHTTKAGLLQIENEHETRYTETKNSLSIITCFILSLRSPH